MKKVLFILAGVAIISSCSITKRHYNSGFAVDFGSKRAPAIEVGELKQTPKKTTVNVDELKIAGIEQKSNLPSTLDNISNSEKPEISISLGSFLQNKKSESQIGKANSNASAPAFFNKTTKNVAAKILNKKLNKSTVPDEGCVLTVLIFLCCLIIPPLGYYLSTGEIDTKFWICLICALLAGGLVLGLGSANYGILGLVAVIIALLGFFSS